ncbi:arrestin domain-containing protein 3-like isoform X3 [Hypomesus transpacificus]|uniref:arrestin domain-containing protein 3-like isoform X3 n=1 Tax=Hypomesus transpacificus TaxID=137520 RepID=UPI001F083D27|nr:arrestin domain-containing protein 3-like isoform X3 [Hypomesus transpacificus]
MFGGNIWLAIVAVIWKVEGRNGRDSITGRITVDLSKQIKIESVIFKSKGKTNVCWTEYYGQYSQFTYHAKEKYYSIEHTIQRGGTDDEAARLILVTMTIKQFQLDYDTVNSRGTFSAGDALSGRVTVKVSKVTKVQCFWIKIKGKAEVMWSDQDGQSPVLHCNKKRYFCFEQIILQERGGDGSEIIAPGKHVYPFTFQIPKTNMPSSFKGKWGQITYSLKAKLTRTIWMVYKVKKEFTFVSKSDLPITILGLKEPQRGTKMSFLPFGIVTMNVISEKMGFIQGEAFEVQVEVHNSSTRTVTPKIYLDEKQTFLAETKGNVHTNEIQLGACDPVPASSSLAVSRVLTIPSHLHPTVFNCSLIKVEYRLKELMLHTLMVRYIFPLTGIDAASYEFSMNGIDCHLV